MRKAPPLVFDGGEFCEFVAPTEGEALIGSWGHRYYYMAMWRLQMWPIDMALGERVIFHRIDLNFVISNYVIWSFE